MFRTADPEEHYGYYGPRVSENGKKEDAFDGIFDKLVKLDAENKMPSFSVPSEELLLLLKISAADHDHSACAGRFQQVTNDMDDLKKSFQALAAAVQTAPVPLAASGVPPGVRNRLSSTSSSKRGRDETETHQTDTDDGDDFEYQRDQRRRYAKQAKHKHTATEPGKPSYTDAARSKGKPKPPSKWGTAKPTSNFKGAVQQVFMYHCDKHVTTTDVTDYFKSNNVNIDTIEKKSHESAVHTSFRMTPATQEDYDRIMDAEILPAQVAVRRYIPTKWTPPTPNDKKPNQFKLAERALEQAIEEAVESPAKPQNVD